jgi:hypothetical protein
MKTLPVAITSFALLISAPADAIVGGGASTTEGIGRSVITIVGSRGNFCTGALIASKVVLTAAHCVQPGADYRIVEYGADKQPALRAVKTVAIHPGFNMQAMLGHRRCSVTAIGGACRRKITIGVRQSQHSHRRRQPLYHCRHRRDRAR